MKHFVFASCIFRFVKGLKLKSLCNKMSTLQPPAIVKGMVVLDKTLFTKEVTVPAVVVEIDSHSHFQFESNISILVKQLKPCMLKVRQIKPVQNTDGNKKIILLNPDGSTKSDDDLLGVAPILRTVGR